MSDNEEYNPTTSADHEEDDDFIEEEEPASKKQKSNAGEKRKRDDTSKNTGDGEHVFQLTTRRRISVRAFSNGLPSVDIRETYKDKVTGELKFGKGICLPLAQWETLKELMPDIDEAITKIQKK
ncbi:PC4-domain-containing protein [Lichtheimia hyalospora FSU 10163]|nr:PC4-domain-containing protein [Lichtheimia hyalospora FSU 10163]